MSTASSQTISQQLSIRQLYNAAMLKQSVRKELWTLQSQLQVALAKTPAETYYFLELFVLVVFGGEDCFSPRSPYEAYSDILANGAEKKSFPGLLARFRDVKFADVRRLSEPLVAQP